MDSSASWQNFLKTGNVEDYLKYVNILRTVASELEHDCKRDSNKGNRI